MERWDSDGNPKPVEPGEVAAIDQMSMKFRDLRDTLVSFNERALSILAGRHRGEDMAGQMGSLQAGLHQVMHEAFGEHGDPQSVHSFVMYLINDLCELRARDYRLADMVNNAGSHLNMILVQLDGMAEGLGMSTVDDDPGEHGETFTTGIGQKLVNVHRKDDCVGWCVIHRPLPGPWRDWPTVWRGDQPFDIWRGFERRCPCGVGHTAMEEAIRGNAHPHGCCGICPCAPPDAVPVFDDHGNLEGYQ